MIRVVREVGPVCEVTREPRIVAEMRWWAQYTVLYGGTYEEVIARRNGYDNAAHMRHAKYLEFLRNLDLGELAL